MNFLNDLIFRYCLIFGRRFFIKEKITFLRVISKELMQLGYHLDAKIAKLQLTKRKYTNFYNGYIGDLNKSDIIICTYYDTGIKNYNLTTKYAFNNIIRVKDYFISLLPLFFIFLLLLAVDYLYIIPTIQLNSFVSFSGLFFLLTTLFFIYFIIRYQKGIPNKKNFICNSSSIILILNLINKLNKKQKERIGFALLDGGCSNAYGLKMLESYLKEHDNKIIIFLDSVGNGDELLIFKPANYMPTITSINFIEGNIETQFPHYLLITSGKLDKNNQVKILYANSNKDNSLSIERIERYTENILDLSLHLITKVLKKGN